MKFPSTASHFDLGNGPPVPQVLVYELRGADQNLSPQITAGIDEAVAACGGLAIRFHEESAGDGQSADVQMEYFAAVVVLNGPPLPDDSILKSVRELTQQGMKVVCCATAAGTWPLSVQCLVMLKGAVKLLDSAEPDFALKLRWVLAGVLRVAQEKREQESQLKVMMRECGIVGESSALLSIFRKVQRISALGDLPTLITGETGTGKERLAKAIYRLDSKRQRGPFIAVNCGAISRELAESELFGHRRGAYTGADRDRKGLIRAADGGILFLDEIGELPPDLQAKLLRVLQEGRVLGVGEEHEAPVNIRIIAATNRDLSEMMRQGKFRADLFYRLNAVSIHIPPLRQRQADIGPLIEHFLHKYRQLAPNKSLTVEPAFLQALTQAELPGNVRQLENLVRSALISKPDNGPLNLGDLPPDLWQQLASPAALVAELTSPAFVEPSAPQPQQALPPTYKLAANLTANQAANPAELAFLLSHLMTDNDWTLAQLLSYCEDLLVRFTLRLADGNQSQAARILRITPRSVYNKLHKHPPQH